MSTVTGFTREYGRFSATKFAWFFFFAVFAFQAMFNGATVALGEWFSWTIQFDPMAASSMIGVNGLIYAFRRHSECKHGLPLAQQQGVDEHA